MKAKELEFWHVMGVATLVTMGGFLLWLLAHAIGVIGTVATAPGSVINKTLQTDNIIHNYEWFFDVNAQFNARRGQIATHSKMLAAEKDAAERSRLNIELAAMRQSCRDLATKYTANSDKANRSLFKSRGLPETLSINDCEA